MRKALAGTMTMAGLLMTATLACGASKAKAPEMQTDEQKTLYALGLVISENIAGFNLSEADLALVSEGLKDGALKRERKVDLQQYGPKIQEMAQSRQQAGAAAEKSTGDDYLAKAAAEPGAVKAPSGFVYKETQAGTGPAPKPTDKVRVHYRGTLIDGTEFDSSYKRNQPAVFALNGVVPCWTQGVQMMKSGGKARLVCPPDLAYGDRGAPPLIKPGATLVFEVELLGIEP